MRKEAKERLNENMSKNALIIKAVEIKSADISRELSADTKKDASSWGEWVGNVDVNCI